MKKNILVGCDLHDKTSMLMIAVGQDAPVKKVFRSDASGRKAMIADLLGRAKALDDAQVYFTYEASALGFGLYDDLAAAGITCFVLAPSKIARSPHDCRTKTDENDAVRLLEILRGHVLAGNNIPSVTIPTRQLRDDREIVRARLDAQDKSGTVKTQIRTLLKRHGIEKPAQFKSTWTLKYRAWLQDLSVCDAPLPIGARVHLASLLRQLQCAEDEVRTLDGQIEVLSATPRYAKAVQALLLLGGVGMLTSMVFLTELGDLTRFKNRRKFGSFIGIVPSAYDSGERIRKGHITHQGPDRVRFVLCQAAWNRIRLDEAERRIYDEIVRKNPKRKKIALVAIMRRLAIRMWHTALNATRQSESVAA